MNRAARRAKERAQSKSAIKSSDWGSVEDQSFPPEPGPIGTELGTYRFGGKLWVLMTFHQPNSTVRVVMSPSDARQLAKDIIGVADGVVLKDSAEEQTGSGIVVAKEMPT